MKNLWGRNWLYSYKFKLKTKNLEANGEIDKINENQFNFMKEYETKMDEKSFLKCFPKKFPMN